MEKSKTIKTAMATSYILDKNENMILDEESKY